MASEPLLVACRMPVVEHGGSVRPNVDFPKLVDLYLDGRLKIDQLISRTWKLDEINEGFAAMRGGQVARGVVVF